jgi:ABC-type maltose transport system permease subunit
MRAPGMRMFRMPIFTWNMLVTSIIVLIAFPVVTSAGAMLFADRQLDAHIYDVPAGGSAVLWQHLFWFFGHPEVYILVLPFFGVITEVTVRRNLRLGAMAEFRGGHHQVSGDINAGHTTFSNTRAANPVTDPIFQAYRTVVERHNIGLYDAGFARLRAPGRNFLFLFVLSTLLLPPQVTLIPQFILFSKLGWLNSYLSPQGPPNRCPGYLVHGALWKQAREKASAERRSLSQFRRARPKAPWPAKSEDDDGAESSGNRHRQILRGTHRSPH